jgi:hypothetical protein
LWWKFSIPKKKILFFYKIFSWDKIFIKSMSQKTKIKLKKKTQPLSLTTSSHTTKKIIPWKIKEISPSYLQNQLNFSLPCHPRNKPFGLVPISNKIHFSQSIKKKLLWRGVELTYPRLFTQKKPFWKRFFKKNPCPLFLKLHLQLVILSI